MSGEQMQAKITAARREAEGLKDKIKRRKDELADTSRTTPIPPSPHCYVLKGSSFLYLPRPLQAVLSWGGFVNCTDFPLPSSPPSRAEPDRCPTTNWNEAPTYAERSPRQDLCYALVHRQAPSCFGFAGRKAHHLGCLHNKQGPRDSPALILGHDLCLRPERKLRRLRWSRQHLFDL